MEIQRLIGRSLRAVTDLEGFGERTVRVDCDVIQADGGTRTASVTGGFIAVALAVRRLRADGLLEDDPIRLPVSAVSCGIVGGETVLDLDYVEDSSAEVDMNFVLAADGRFVEVQGTAEGEPFDRARLDQMIDLARKGAEELFAIQRRVIEADG